VTTSTVAALLTILGYSLYDTVIVFDRIRENAPRMPRAAFSQIVNRSMSEVLTRSLVTSLSTLLSVAALLTFGGETLKDFAFALLVGIASGTYSSIFIASPVLTAWKEREAAFVQRRRRIIESLGMVPAYAVATVGGAPEAAPSVGRPAPSRRREPEPSTSPPEPEELVSTDGADVDGESEEEVIEVEQPEDAETQLVPGTPDPNGAKRSEPARPPRSERKKRTRQQRRRKHGRRR
jgi:SecD/SecF fusion protein